MNEIHFPYEFEATNGNKVSFPRATALSLDGNKIKAQQRAAVISRDRKEPIKYIEYPVEIDAQYAASLYVTCQQLKAQGYGPYDFALVSPVGSLPGQAKFFLPAELIAANLESISVTLRLRAVSQEIYVNTLTGQVGVTHKEVRLCLKYMEQNVLSIDSKGNVFSAREEKLQVTVEEVVHEMKEAITTGRKASIGKGVIFPKPYVNCSLKMYEEVIAQVEKYIVPVSKLGGSW